MTGIATLLGLAGIGLLVLAAWLLAPLAGLAALGLALVTVAYFLGDDR